MLLNAHGCLARKLCIQKATQNLSGAWLQPWPYFPFVSSFLSSSWITELYFSNMLIFWFFFVFFFLPLLVFFSFVWPRNFVYFGVFRRCFFLCFIYRHRTSKQVGIGFCLFSFLFVCEDVEIFSNRLGRSYLMIVFGFLLL